MRARRHKLAVSTFPFLAVLLCAMGSLILILLVMDRKAHQAAQARAKREAARLVEERTRSEFARRREEEQKQQQARAAWDQKREALHANLSRQQIELQLQMRKVRDQLREIADRLRYEQDTTTELRHKVQGEHDRLKTEQQLLEGLRTTAQQTGEQSKESSKTLQRMTADLLQMEQALKDLKAARQREQHTFSVVPYHGRRGESRRPIYVECTADDVIFHPERRIMPVTSRRFLLGQDQPASTPDDVRAEVERRIARQRAKATDSSSAVPYLLLLVRPDGIGTYCQFQSVLKDMTLDFGYEFIDADWVLDFPADDEQPSAQPWMASAHSTAPAAAAKETSGRARPMGLAPQQPLSAAAGVVVQGIRTGTAPGSGQWTRGGSGQLGGGSGVPASGSFAVGAGTGAAGPSVSGSAPGGTGASASPGVRFFGPSGGNVGGNGGDIVHGTPELAVGPAANRTGQPGGAAPFLVGQGGGSGAAPGQVSASASGGLGQGGSGSSRGRGSSGQGHPAALAPALANGAGDPGAPEGEGSTVGGFRGAGGYAMNGAGRGGAAGATASGAGGNSTGEAPGLGPPRALALNSSRQGQPGNGMYGDGSARTGTLGEGISGTGVAGSGMAGHGPSGQATSGDGRPTVGVPVQGRPGDTPMPSGGPSPGRYTIARANGGEGSGQPGAPAATAVGDPLPGAADRPPSGQPGSPAGAARGTVGSTASANSPGMAAGGIPSGTVGPVSANASQVREQPGNRGATGASSPGVSTATPGATGGSPDDGSPGPMHGNGPAVFASVDPLAPRTSAGSRASAEGNGGLAEPPAAERPPDEPPAENPPRRRLVPAGSGSGERGGPGSPAAARFATPTAGPPRRRPASGGLRPAWVHGGRDWTIYIECRADAVVLYPSERTFTVAQAASDAAFNPLVAVLRQMIERRQSARRPGEPPFYPKVCLLVRSENLRTFLTVYPALEAVPVPKTRQNLDPDDDVGDIVRGVNP
jgi:hypothetical protein